MAVIYLLIISPILSLQEEWGRELVKKRQLLARYQALQVRGPAMVRADQALKTALTTLEGQFLAGGNAAVAASDLQEIVKNLAETHGLTINSTKILPSQEAGPYVEVPIQVQMTSSINQLNTFLFHLEHHKKLLFIPEIEINSPRRLGREVKSPPLQVNLVILGVIKKKAAT